MKNREIFVAQAGEQIVYNLKIQLKDLLAELKHYEDDDTVKLTVNDGEFVISTRDEWEKISDEDIEEVETVVDETDTEDFDEIEFTPEEVEVVDQLVS